MRSRAEWSRRALRAALVVAPGGLWVAVPACSTDPNTITLLAQPDGGKKPEPEPTSCSGDADCTGGAPFCDVSEQKCVECLSAAQCPDDHPCVAETHTCEPPCTSNNDCAGIDRPVCSPTGVCVQCEADPDCESMPLTPHCNIRNGLCVACVVQLDCGQTFCIDDCLACVNNACVRRT
jgi:hypothetical protein